VCGLGVVYVGSGKKLEEVSGEDAGCGGKEWKGEREVVVVVKGTR
jgi:hypothetical protein